MMKTQISAALRQPPTTSLPTPSISKVPSYSYIKEDIQPTVALTPPKATLLRRRPVLTTQIFLQKNY